MTSILNSLIKLPRFIKILSTNGIDENNAVVLKDERQRKHAYYETHKEQLSQYYHDRYERNKEDILQKKRERNKLPEVKIRSSEYHKKYYQDHKEELKLKHKEYSKKRKRN